MSQTTQAQTGLTHPLLDAIRESKANGQLTIGVRIPRVERCQNLIRLLPGGGPQGLVRTKRGGYTFAEFRIRDMEAWLATRGVVIHER